MKWEDHQTGSGPGLPDCTNSLYDFSAGTFGVSIFLPQDRVPWTTVYDNYVRDGNEHFAFCQDTAWNEAIEAYFDPNCTLFLSYVHGSWGQVEITPPPSDPCLPRYNGGTQVTLLAVPIDGKAFDHWGLYHQDHPGDPNYITNDANNPIVIVMDHDREVTAAFRCGSGVDQALPLVAIGTAIVVFAARRMRRR